MFFDYVDGSLILYTILSAKVLNCLTKTVLNELFPLAWQWDKNKLFVRSAL